MSDFKNQEAVDVHHDERYEKARDDKAANSESTAHLHTNQDSTWQPLQMDSPTEYKLYKARFVGCVALCFLNAMGGMNWLWFSAIALETSTAFDISVNKVNWLSDCVNLIYLPVSFLIPWAARRIGLRKSYILAAACLIVGSWLRYAGTSKSLPPGGAYALLLLGQLVAGFSQPWYQVLAPAYSQAWFGLKSRTTATMIISLSNPIGSALAQLLSSIFDTPRSSILVLGIITTVIAPCALLIQDRPPTPPTYAGSQDVPPIMVTVRSALGFPLPDEVEKAMTLRQRIDFWILTIGFGIIVGIISAFSILIAQVYSPYGYDANASGLVGAALFIAGLVGAVSISPLFDRVFTNHLAWSLRLVLPIVAGAWIGLIWAISSHGLGPSYGVLCVAGFSSFMLLPVTLELACEVTGSAETSAASLWFSANVFTVLFVLVADSLRAGPDASPPGNLRKVLIMFAIMSAVVSASMIGLEGRQSRRRLDEDRARDNRETI
ncbi:hypothetical protein FRB94_001911 [Tulasnella sp. JGI-2019a]|nr:hypothetical protein FRB93_004033 [Tulasnella sp. JGI-2019a]KAG9005021.1 hypothetical protein FRB94_001911 [Tulasnella sp. JGI-2019a]KAG9031930.1 hypothetical protein FRB95_002066 [Tulasnella sp. JGI-2019a]